MGCSLQFLIKIECDVAKFLLDVPDNFTFGGGVEGVTALRQIFDQILGKITASKVETKDGVGKSKTFVDGNRVRDTITRVQDDTGGTTGSVEGQNGLNSNVKSGSVEGLEHDLRHLFTVSLGVEGGLSEQDGVLLGSNTEFVIESVMPNLLHIVPVGDNTVLDGVLEGENTTLGLSLVTEWRSEGA